MATRKLGFDLDEAIESLHGEALALGAKPAPGCDPANPHAIALDHVAAHGIRKEGPRCEVHGCKLAGVCFALFELVEYRREATSHAIQARLSLFDISSDAHNALAALADTFVKPACVALQALLVACDEASEAGLREQAGRLRRKLKSGRRAMHLMAQLSAALNELADGICDPIQSPELLKPTASGRSPDLLLTAMYQHLSRGGYSPREAGELVRDGLGGKPTNRVRNRCNSPDARWIIPAPPSSNVESDDRAH